MSLATQYAAAVDPAFQQRIEQAMVAAAISISSEGTGPAFHAQRVAYARLILNSPAAYLAAFAQAVASQALDNTATDAAINTAVSSVYNALAGAVA